MGGGGVGESPFKNSPHTRAPRALLAMGKQATAVFMPATQHRWVPSVAFMIDGRTSEFGRRSFRPAGNAWEEVTADGVKLVREVTWFHLL